MAGTTRKLIATASMLGSAIFAAPATAQSLQDTFWIQASGFAANANTDVQVSPSATPDSGTVIDLETDLGLDDSSLLPAIFAGARLGGGFIVTAEYYSLGRDSTKTLERTLVFEDVTYPASGSVEAGFDSDIYRFTIGYVFVRSEQFELGAALGLHATDLGFEISGQGMVGSAPISTQIRRKELLAPMPTVGLFASYEPMPRLTITARADYLSLGIGDYDGSVLNAQAAVAYRVMRNVGVGVGYRYVDYDLDVTKDNYVGAFDYNFWGPSFFVEVGF